MTADVPLIAGIDEVGRGALAGPVVAGAVVLSRSSGTHYPDSKKLSAKKRLLACATLYAGDAQYIGLGWALPAEIDRLNILQATFVAMRRAVARLGCKPDAVLVDGNACPGTGLLEKSVIKADDIFDCVGAASIVAKCFRDRWMMNLDVQYPQYGFAGHKGYGAANHMKAIEQFGGCCWHRQSFAPLKQRSLFAL